MPPYFWKHGAVALLCLAGCAREEVEPVWVKDLLEAERSFSDMLAVDGMRSALLHFLATSSVALGPGPVEGRAWAAEQTDAAMHIRTRHGHVAAAGDLGYSIGLWLRSDSAAGHYVHIWRKKSPGAWRIAFTAWLRHGPVAKTARLDTFESRGWIRSRRKLYQEAARVSMLRADKDLAQRSLDRSARWAFTDVAADSILYLQEGAPPIRGKARMLASLGEDTGILSWIPVEGVMAKAGDLGYAYGFQAARQDSSVQSRAYLRIWKARRDSSWSAVVHAVTRPILDGVGR